MRMNLPLSHLGEAPVARDTVQSLLPPLSQLGFSLQQNPFSLLSLDQIKSLDMSTGPGGVVVKSHLSKTVTISKL